MVYPLSAGWNYARGASMIVPGGMTLRAHFISWQCFSWFGTSRQQDSTCFVAELPAVFGNHLGYGREFALLVMAVTSVR